MQKCAGAIITWLIHQQAIQERDRELYTYALYNMVLLIIPLGLTVMMVRPPLDVLEGEQNENTT